LLNLTKGMYSTLC